MLLLCLFWFDVCTMQCRFTTALFRRMVLALSVLTIGVLLAVLFEFLMKIVRAQMVDRASKEIDTELSGVFLERYGYTYESELDSWNFCISNQTF